MLGNICGDISCLVIKIPESKQLDIIIDLPILHKTQQEISVSFVDDTDFFAGGENAKRNIEEILKLYAELF